MAARLELDQVRQIATPIDDAEDLDHVVRTFVRVGAGLEENEVRPLDEQTCGSPNVGATRPEPGMTPQPVGLGFDRCI